MMKELQIKEAEISSLTDKLKRLQQEGAEKVRHSDTINYSHFQCSCIITGTPFT